jgi:hypothetical protein
MKLLECVSKRELNIAKANAIIAFAFAMFVVVQPAVPTWEYLALIAKFLVLMIPLAALSLVGFALLNARDVGMIAALQDRWRSDRLVTLLWPVLLFAIVMSSFSAFKQRILPLAGFHFDPALAAIDRNLFGLDLGLWLHQTIGSPMLTYFLDAIYHAWFLPMSVGVGIVALCTDARTRMQYMTAFTMTWIGLGSILAYLLPAAGPCFWGVLVGPIGNGPFQAVNDALLADRAARSANFLFTIEVRDMLLARFNNPDLSIGGGISAIPSIHNAMAVLFALVGYRFNRAFGLCMSAFAALIWIGSIYLNWHYAIDGIVGAAGAIGLWYGAGFLTGPAHTRETTPSGRAMTSPAKTR